MIIHLFHRALNPIFAISCIFCTHKPSFYQSVSQFAENLRMNLYTNPPLSAILLDLRVGFWLYRKISVYVLQNSLKIL